MPLEKQTQLQSSFGISIFPRFRVFAGATL